MLHANQAAKRKRRSKAVPVLGAAGLLSLASGASAQSVGAAVDMPTWSTDASHEITLSEEEVSDVSLATFYVFDKETTAVAPGVQLVRGGCGGCGRGCGESCGGRDAEAEAAEAEAADALEAASDVEGVVAAAVAGAVVGRGARAAFARA